MLINGKSTRKLWRQRIKQDLSQDLNSLDYATCVTYPWYTAVWNRHRESKTTKFYEIGSGTKLFITFELKVFRHEERETQSFYADCFYIVSQPTRGARSVQSRLASPSSESQPSSSEAGTQLTAFSQISAHASGAWRHPNALVPIPICDFYFDICEWRILSARAWTPAHMFAPN